jgi:hypothetical protein
MNDSHLYTKTQSDFRRCSRPQIEEKRDPRGRVPPAAQLASLIPSTSPMAAAPCSSLFVLFFSFTRTVRVPAVRQLPFCVRKIWRMETLERCVDTMGSCGVALSGSLLARSSSRTSGGPVMHACTAVGTVAAQRRSASAREERYIRT